MIDYRELMAIFSVPRPNGSVAERQTARHIQEWLRKNDIPYQVQSFRQYPYYFETIGIWIILSRTLLAASIWLHWGWWTAPIALIGLAGGLLDEAFHIPTVSRFGSRQGENILVEYQSTVNGAGIEEKTPPAAQEIILSAHYDSKTELLDHRQRMVLLMSIPPGILLSLLLGFLGPIWFSLHSQAASGWASLAYWAGILLSMPMLVSAWALGLNLSLGRFVEPSPGAVDNGSACAILLGLAERLGKASSPLVIRDKIKSGPGIPSRTRITLALFSGEEIDRQGSRAFARLKSKDIPAVAINLEAMAQDGDYVYWERDGSLFGLSPTDARVNRLICAAVQSVTGKPACPAGPVLSDGASFLEAGIPAGVLGTLDSKFKLAGFHRPSDNLSRVVMDRLPEAVEILYRCIVTYDLQE